MKKNLNMLVRWYKLARPNKKYLFVDIIIILFGVICLIIEPIYAAKVIANLTKNNFFTAIICLSYYYILISAERLLLIIKYKRYSKLIGSIYLPL